MESELGLQIKVNQNNRRLEKDADRRKDDEYLQEFKDRKDLTKHYATAGNIGKVDGPTKEEIAKKANDIQQMKEVWKRSQEVNLLKNKI